MPLPTRLAPTSLPGLLGREHAQDLGNLLVVAPAGIASSVAEGQALRAARQATRVIYALADAASAAARFAALAPQAEGIRLVLAGIADEAEDLALCRGAFDLLVITVERLGDLLARGPHLADAVGLVVVDGLEVVAGAAGVLHDRALTLLRLASLPPRICGVVHDPADAVRIGRWLGARVDGDGTQIGLDLDASAPAPTAPPLAPIVLHLPCAGLLRGDGELRRRVLTSFAGHATYESLGARARDGFAAALDAAVERCKEAAAIRQGADLGLTATDTGRLAARLGVDLADLADLARWVSTLGRLVPSTPEIAVAIGRALTGVHAPADADARATILAAARHQGAEGRPLLRALAEDLWSLGAAIAAALARAARLLAALDGTEDASEGDTLRPAAARPLLAAAALARDAGHPAAQVAALALAARRLDRRLPPLGAPALRVAPPPPPPAPPRRRPARRAPAARPVQAALFEL